MLPDVAAQQGVAVLIHPVLAGDAEAAALPALQLSFVNKTRLLQAGLV